MQSRQGGRVGDRAGREGKKDVCRVCERGSERRALLKEQGEDERRRREAWRGRRGRVLDPAPRRITEGRDESYVSLRPSSKSRERRMSSPVLPEDAVVAASSTAP